MESVLNLARRARIAGLSEDFQLGHQTLDEAAGLLSHDGEKASAWIAIERGRLHNTAGDPKAALPFFLDAWKIARANADHNLAVDAAHMLAIASELAEAELWTLTALDYIAANGVSHGWTAMLHYNLGWTYYESGLYDQALICFRKDEKFQSVYGDSQTLKISRYAVVKTLRAMHNLNEAITLGRRVVEDAETAGDKAPFVCEELAECYATVGDYDMAAEFAARAYEVLSGNPVFVRDESERLAKLATLRRFIQPLDHCCLLPPAS
ncbi:MULTISPECIES: tetratricopeptide repeat protein [unclassified Rhizobium]|uniref:tetratricopeptide repeat protein n=1 Tax=unclassified Rhizobium TaxID=2613769 RepID=UPI0006FE16B5|nr:MULTISPECIES: tetratricopeptide repeat protein [unclassified Rhizobium]